MLVTAPVTVILSETLPLAPPSSMFRLELPVRVKSPVMARLPAALVPPGLMLPSLTSAAAPAPTAIVPLPDRVPVLVNPAVLVKVAPFATSMVPLLVKVVGLSVIVPAVTLSVPVLVKGAALLKVKPWPVVLAMIVPALTRVPG